jgi:ParB family transcriptional regulator, chromosome partitioning protein
MAEEARSRLGRGLAALIGDAGEESAAIDRVRAPRRVPVEFLRPNPRNPRRSFSETELEGLAASIRERGVIQPVVVRAVRGAVDAYEIIAGERRWRAAQRAGLHDVPIVLLEVSDREALELAIIENVQRSDLNAIEEAMGYQALAQDFDYSADDVAKVVGKSRSHVANTLRLLNLPESVKAFVAEGKISAGHARALLAVPDPEAVAQQVVDRGLNVRAVESLAQQSAAEQGRAPQRRPRTAVAAKDADIRALEKRVSDALGLKVGLDHRGGAGTLHIHYGSLEQLEDVLRRLERS